MVVEEPGMLVVVLCPVKNETENKTRRIRKRTA
jgi:hypothetical protein